jgi:hypothetical protein
MVPVLALLGALLVRQVDGVSLPLMDRVAAADSAVGLAIVPVDDPWACAQCEDTRANTR